MSGAAPAKGYRRTWTWQNPRLTWNERESEERRSFGKAWKMNTAVGKSDPNSWGSLTPAELRMQAAQDNSEDFRTPYYDREVQLYHRYHRKGEGKEHAPLNPEPGPL